MVAIILEIIIIFPKMEIKNNNKRMSNASIASVSAHGRTSTIAVTKDISEMTTELSRKRPSFPVTYALDDQSVDLIKDVSNHKP